MGWAGGGLLRKAPVRLVLGPRGFRRLHTGRGKASETAGWRLEGQLAAG